MVLLEGYGLVGGPPQQLPRGGLVLFITATFAAAVVTGVAGVRIWVDRLSDRAESPATIRCDQISAQEPAEACKARTSRCVSSRLCKSSTVAWQWALSCGQHISFLALTRRMFLENFHPVRQAQGSLCQSSFARKG